MCDRGETPHMLKSLVLWRADDTVIRAADAEQSRAADAAACVSTVGIPRWLCWRMQSLCCREMQWVYWLA